MRHELLTAATVAATLFSTGCMRSLTSSTFQPDVMSVSVRFVLPSEQERYSVVDAQADAQLVADSSSRRCSDQEYHYDTTAWSHHPYHVALWGGPYDGTDVTTQPTALPPGSYTFALFDQPHTTAMQGWLEVRNTRSDLVSVLAKWRDSIAEHKQQLAYDLEIDGRTSVSDPEVFKSFKKQIQAYNRLERWLETAIKAEYRPREARPGEVRDLLRQADLVIMPGEDSFFNPTTQPTFSEDDLKSIRAGDAMAKIVLAADYREAQWKLSRINRLYENLAQFREVLRQEADRLERRKSWLLITDHLYHHGKRFVENEIQLQHTRSLINRFHEHASDLRERRMALAFVTSLFTPNANFGALDKEEDDLLRERIVLEAKRQQLDRSFDATDESSVRRVALEQSRQDVIAMIDAINRQIEDIRQARTGLASMVKSTNVIHRHNDARLLTTTLVADRLPPRIVRMVEREAMMTVRLEAADDISVPRPADVAATKLHRRPTMASKVLRSEDERASYTGVNANVSGRTATAGQREPTSWQQSRTSRRHNEAKKRYCPWYIRMICPPCWFDKSACEIDPDK